MKISKEIYNAFIARGVSEQKIKKMEEFLTKILKKSELEKQNE